MTQKPENHETHAKNRVCNRPKKSLPTLLIIYYADVWGEIHQL